MTTDESVLAFIGRSGRSTAAVAERFPGFDVMRLVRAQLVDIAYAEPGETVAHLQELELGEMRYVLTDRGAAAHDRLADVVDELRATLTEGLTDEEQAATAVALERMARNLGWNE